MPKIDRTSSLTSTPRAQAVSPATTPTGTQAVVARGGPVTEYAGQAVAQKELVPRGKQVTTSADPSALWGEAPKSAIPSQDEFAALPTEKKRETLMALRQERQEAAREIQARLEKLDIKWSRSRLVTRTEALREYQEKTAHLDPGTKKELDALLERSEGAQRKINELRAKIDRLPKTPEAKKAQAELRSQLARELRRARDEQSKVVKQATAVVDQQGLKTDRLATTEQIIDPTALAPGSGQSLLEKIAHFFKLDSFINWVATAFADLFSKPAEQRREEKRAEEDDERRKRLDDRIRTQKLAERQQVEKTDQAAISEQAVENVRALLNAALVRATAS